MTISEKVSYIKGLCDGMKLDKESDNGKITYAIIDALNDISTSIEDSDKALITISDELDDIEEGLEELSEAVEDLDEQVEDLSEAVFEDDDDYDFDFDEDKLYELTCAKCKNVVSIDMSVLDEDFINCPNCGEKIEFDIDFLIDDDEEDEE